MEGDPTLYDRRKDIVLTSIMLSIDDASLGRVVDIHEPS